MQLGRGQTKNYMDQDSLVDLGPMRKESADWMSGEIFIQQEYRQAKHALDPNVLMDSEDGQRNRSKDSQNLSPSNKPKSSRPHFKVDFPEVGDAERLQATYRH